MEDDVLKLNTLLIPLHEASDLALRGVTLEEHGLDYGWLNDTHAKELIRGNQSLEDFVVEQARHYGLILLGCCP